MGNAFTRLARGSAYAAALASVVYSIAFVTVVQRGAHGAQWTAAVALTAGALFALPVLVAVTSALGDSDDKAGPARLALIVGGTAAVMTSLHGAYDVAVLAKPVSATVGEVSPVDPRGFATFALSGVAVVLIAALARGDERFPRWLPAVGFLLGAALVATWLGRLIVLDPTSGWLRVSTFVAAVLSPVVYSGFASACGRRASAAQSDIRTAPTADRRFVSPA